MFSEEIHPLRQQFEKFEGADINRDALIEELFALLDELTEEFKKRVNVSQNDLRSDKKAMNQDPFILVLVDGAGMIFEDRFISKGALGGREAADLLWRSIHHYLQQHVLDTPINLRIAAKIYADLAKWEIVRSEIGIIDQPENLREFARGFTSSKISFDFIDVGTGDCSATMKMSECLKLHVYDCNCRQIFLGCCHDSHYTRLRESTVDPSISERIVFLEDGSSREGLASLASNFHEAHFEGLFRTIRINPSPTQDRDDSFSPILEYRSPSPPTTTSDGTSSSLDPADSPGGVPLTLMKRTITPPNDAPAPPPTSPPTSPYSRVQTLRNRDGQRIDPILQPDIQALKRIKCLKLCNVHFLRKDCRYDTCEHEHNCELSEKDLISLEYLSRLTPCKFGSTCGNSQCLHGHVCPNSVDGEKNCRFGESCRFTPEQHGINRTPVNVPEKDRTSAAWWR